MRKKVTQWFDSWKVLPLYIQVVLFLALGVSVALVLVGEMKSVIFTYDQARDATQAYSIWHNHNLKLIGPETDIPGVFHGVLWYYVLAVLYAVGKTPDFVALMFCFGSLLSILIVGILSWELFANREVTAGSIILYSLSPLFQTTSRWISNPTLSFLITPLLLLLLWRFYQKNNWWMTLLIGMSFGVVIQSEFAFVVLPITVLLYSLLFKYTLRGKDVIAFASGLMILVSSFLVAEIKFKAQGIKGMMEFIHKGAPAHTVSDTLLFISKRIIDLFSISFMPLPQSIISVLIIICIILCIIFIKQQKKSVIFLLLWIVLLFPFLLFRVGISTSYFLFFPFLVPVILLVTYELHVVFRKKAFFILIILIIALGQMQSSYRFIATNTSPLPAQQGATLQYAKQVVAYTYAQAKGEPFTIITITNPLFINTTWAYLYTTYGKPSHGYLPYFEGRSQKDNLGYLPEKQFATKIRFLILEPTIGIPTFYITLLTNEENKVSHLDKTQYFGDYKVENRTLHFTN